MRRPGWTTKPGSHRISNTISTSGHAMTWWGAGSEPTRLVYTARAPSTSSCRPPASLRQAIPPISTCGSGSGARCPSKGVASGAPLGQPERNFWSVRPSRDNDLVLSLREDLAPATFEPGATFAIDAVISAKFPERNPDFHKFADWSADDGTLIADVRNRKPFLRARNLTALIERIVKETAAVTPERSFARKQFVVRWEN